MKSKLEEFSKLWGVEVTYLEATTSTNDIAREVTSAQGDIVIAECQSAGRGQRGNRWTSPSGENLMFSLLLTPLFLSAEEQFYVSKAVSLAVCQAFREYEVQAMIKWPNDIYVDDRKIAGILIEHDVTGDSITRSIIGIGINVNQREFDPSLPNPTSMALETSSEYFDRVDVLSTFYEKLTALYDLLGRDGKAEIDSQYMDALYLLGQPHTFTEPGGRSYRGVIRNVLPDGQIRIEDEAGHTHIYLFKEVSY